MSTSPPKNQLVGDFIRIMRVPGSDLQQRIDEVARHSKLPGHTANTIERIIAENPIVEIYQIDSFGYPWYKVSLASSNGQIEEHTLMLYDDGTWEKVEH